jgi:hypothetical protein
VITLAFLPAQSEKKIKLFVGDGARIRREVNALHEFSDTALSVAIDARSFGLSFPVRHVCLPLIRKAFLPENGRNMVNERLTLALSI